MLGVGREIAHGSLFGEEWLTGLQHIARQCIKANMLFTFQRGFLVCGL